MHLTRLLATGRSSLLELPLKPINRSIYPIGSRGISCSSRQMNKQTTDTHSSNLGKKKESIAEADERIRRMLLDRDGGSASVPTREGKWDNDMGRETARHMFRVLDQARHAKPGAQNAQGEGESRFWSRRNY